MADGNETRRSLAELRSRWPLSAVEKVEYWNSFAKKRHDLFGFGDILVGGPDAGFVIVQVTTRKQMSARRRKILGKLQVGDRNPQSSADYRVSCLLSWLRAGGRVLVQGWDQPEGRGTRWMLTEWEITEDLL
jgi:hypothetical protein